MGTREISTRNVRVAGLALAVATALSACGGGSDGSAPVLAQAASRVPALSVSAAAPTPTPRIAATATANLLSNPGFDAGMTDWANWSNADVVDVGGAYGAVLRIGAATGGAGHEVGGIVPNTRYRLTSQAVVSDASDAVYIGINFLDASNAVVAQQASAVTSTAPSLATVELVAPANAAKAVVFAWKNAGAGVGYADDFMFVPADAVTAPASTATNLVSNGGFESALTDWNNWGNSTPVTGASSSGTSAVRVGNGAGGLGHDVAGVVGGRTYRLSAQARVSDGSEVAYLGLSFFDAAGAKLVEQNVAARSTTYAAAQLDVAAPANTARAQVYIWKNAGSGFAYVDDVALAPIDGAVVAAPAPTASPTPAPAPAAPAPAPAAVDVGAIPLGVWPSTLLQIGRDSDAYWVEDGVWGAWGLTRGGYTGPSGLNYEQYTGVSPNIGPNGEVAFRMAWKWPTCCNEIKSFPSIVSGRKPGWFNSWTKPGGFDVQLLDGSYAQTYPSGATPGTFFPLQLPLASLKTSFSYQHMTTPSGRGHLAYDIFLQQTPDQLSGFGANISHEIIIPLDYWGGYGQYPTRNPGWYDHDVTIDGRLFHVYVVKDADGVVRPSFAGGWKFIIFEPDQPIAPGTLDLAKFINYTSTRRDAAGTPWTNGNEYAVSVELGVEAENGVGDIQVGNYRVWR